MSQRSESEASKVWRSLLTGYVADQSLADAIAEAEIYVATDATNMPWTH